MSRSNPTENLTSPCKRYFEWSSENGAFKYYDKEKKENVNVPLPFKFIVLDELNTVKGFSNEKQSSFWANEVRDTKKDILTVRTKLGIEMSGVYEQIKEKLSGKGAKYCKSVYIAYYEGKVLTIGNVGFMGASVGPWIDFAKENKVGEIAVQVKTAKEGKVGKVTFKSPVFEATPISEAANSAAIALDAQLQTYLFAYLGRNQKKEEAAPTVNVSVAGTAVSSKSTKVTPAQTLDVMDELFGEADDSENPPF